MNVDKKLLYKNGKTSTEMNFNERNNSNVEEVFQMLTKIYGTESCVACKMLVAEYKDEGKEYEYIDVATLDPEAIRELSENHGRHLPIVVKEEE